MQNEMFAVSKLGGLKQKNTQIRGQLIKWKMLALISYPTIEIAQTNKVSVVRLDKQSKHINNQYLW